MRPCNLLHALHGHLTASCDFTGATGVVSVAGLVLGLLSTDELLYTDGFSAGALVVATSVLGELDAQPAGVGGRNTQHVGPNLCMLRCMSRSQHRRPQDISPMLDAGCQHRKGDASVVPGLMPRSAVTACTCCSAVVAQTRATGQSSCRCLDCCCMKHGCAQPRCEVWLTATFCCVRHRERGRSMLASLLFTKRHVISATELDEPRSAHASVSLCMAPSCASCHATGTLDTCQQTLLEIPLALD